MGYGDALGGHYLPQNLGKELKTSEEVTDGGGGFGRVITSVYACVCV